MNDREIVVLEELPGMRGSFARAVLPRRRSGAAVPGYAVRVEQVKHDVARLTAYSRVCSLTVRDPVPPTWLHVIAFPLHVHLLGSRESTVGLLGAVHVSNTMTVHRPAMVDEPLSFTAHVDALRPHHRGALVDIKVTADVNDVPVWQGTSTYLAQGAHVPGDAPQRQRPAPASGPTLARWRLGVGLGRRYRAVSGDPNPIHTSRVAARAFGFPRPIIHGMWTHARALAHLEAHLPDAYRLHVDFRSPIALPSSVSLIADDDSTGLAVTDTTGQRTHMTLTVTDTTSA